MRQRYWWPPRTALTALMLVVGLASSFVVASPDPGAPLGEDNSNSLERMRQELERLGVSGATIVPLKGGALPRVFPSYDWYKWHKATYGKYGGAGWPHLPPKPLGFDDVFAAPHQHGRPILLNSIDGLKGFFQANLAAVHGLEQARDVARAWLTASTAINEDDGNYQFTIEEDSIKAQSSGPRIEVRGKAVVMRGGNGLITIVMTFDQQGKLIASSDMAQLREGPRLACQATKLLDPDPIVRKIAEQDLVFIGPCAKPYLDEKRAHASLELQRAIDRIWERIQTEERRWNAGPDRGSQ